VENFFGLLRRLVHGCNQFDEIRHSTARNAVVNGVFHDLGHSPRVSGRQNAAGVLSRRDMQDKLCPPFTSEIALTKVIQMIQCFHGTSTIIAQKDAEEIETVFAWFSALNDGSTTPNIEKGRHFVIRATANSKIFASLFHTR
jgi:hypothetical protein